MNFEIEILFEKNYLILRAIMIILIIIIQIIIERQIEKRKRKEKGFQFRKNSEFRISSVYGDNDKSGISHHHYSVDRNQKIKSFFISKINTTFVFVCDYIIFLRKQTDKQTLFHNNNNNRGKKLRKQKL